MADIRGGGRIAEKLRAYGQRLGNATGVKAGLLGTAAPYPDGTPVALVGMFNEFGVPSHGQPPRPFMRNTIRDHEKEWPKELAKALQQTGGDAKKALGQIGELIAGDIRNSINNGEYVALAESTKRRKKFDKPLIDTGHMVNSIDSEVITGD